MNGTEQLKNEPVIRLRNVSFSYDETDADAPAVLENLTLDIRRGEFLAVLGHNGSGKSTLAKMLNAVLLPASGKVDVAGMDTADETKHLAIRRMVGMVFQNPDNQIVATVVEEDVAFAPENLGVPREEMVQRVDRALEAVGMTEFRHSAPHQLSGGQKQRVAIAGVLAMMPDVLVLDEPTAMLDPSGRAEVMNTILRLNRERGMTVVLITHHMNEAAMADRVVVMNEGRIVMDDVPRHIFTQVEHLKKLGLDVPQVTELVYELRRAGLDIPGDILNEEECVEALAALLGESR